MPNSSNVGCARGSRQRVVRKVCSSSCLLATIGVLLISGAFAQTAQTPQAQSLGENNYPRLGIATDANLCVIRVQYGSPSQRAGLAVGDRLLSVDGRDVARMDGATRARCLVGQPGTVVHLSLERAKKLYAVDITRSGAQPPVADTQSAAGKSNESPSSASLGSAGLDQRFITVLRHTSNTDEVVRQVLNGLALLPDSVKTNLLDHGVTIGITPTRKELIGSKGGACYQIETKRVVVPEWNDYTNSLMETNMLGRLLLLHELGHAYDNVNGRISFGPEFQGMYHEEERNVPADKRKLLAYFLDEGDNSEQDVRPHRPPEECFASLFASKYAKGNFPRLTALKECFPRCAAFVARLRP